MLLTYKVYASRLPDEYVVVPNLIRRYLKLKEKKKESLMRAALIVTHYYRAEAACHSYI